MRKLYTLAIIVLFLAGYMFSAARMERRLAAGRDVLLALAPVDPRALLMGDYMTLEYTANRAIISALRKGAGHREPASSGRAVMRLEPVGHEGAAAPEARFARIGDGTSLAAGEVALAFSVRSGRVLTAAEAFYFPEGSGGAYEAQAKYGLVRVGEDGQTLLMGLCDAHGRRISPERKAP